MSDFENEFRRHDEPSNLGTGKRMTNAEKFAPMNTNDKIKNSTDDDKPEVETKPVYGGKTNPEYSRIENAEREEFSREMNGDLKQEGWPPIIENTESNGAQSASLEGAQADSSTSLG